MTGLGETGKRMVPVDTLRSTKSGLTKQDSVRHSQSYVKRQLKEAAPQPQPKKPGRPRHEPKVGVDALRSPKPFVLSDQGRQVKSSTKAVELVEESTPVKESIRSEAELPFGWKLDKDHIDLPDGRRIILDADNGTVAIIVTQKALAHGNPAEMELVKKAKASSENLEFLTQEFSELNPSYTAFVLQSLEAPPETHSGHARTK